MKEPIILDGRVVQVALGPNHDPRRRVTVRVNSGSKFCDNDIILLDDTLQLGDEVQLVLEPKTVTNVYGISADKV